MFCSFISDLIQLRDLSSSECLCEKVDLCLLCWRRENSTHCVVSKCRRQMFCSFLSDLSWIKSLLQSNQETNVLLLSLRFDSIRDQVEWVSVWKSRSVSFVLKKRKFDSLCCFEVQKTNVLLLYLRFDSTPRFKLGECLCEKVDLCLLCWRRENSTHCVVSKCRRQMFCSFISDLIQSEIKLSECLCEKVDLCLLCWRRENSTHCVVSKCRRQMFCSFISDLIVGIRDLSSSECLCEKVDLCLLCWRRENSTHCVVSKCRRQMFCSFISDLIRTPRFKFGECLCEKVDLCLLCWRRENSTHCVVSKCRRQMFCSFISDLIVVRDLSWVSVCVKKSICVFCVEEEKIRLTVLFRSAEDKCSAPLSPIWFEFRDDLIGWVSVWKSRSVSFVLKKRKSVWLLWTFEMRKRLKCRFHWKKINQETLTVPTIIQLMHRKQLQPFFTLVFLLHWREECENISVECRRSNHFNFFYKIIDRRIWKKANLFMEKEKLKKFIVWKCNFSTFKEKWFVGKELNLFIVESMKFFFRQCSTRVQIIFLIVQIYTNVQSVSLHSTRRN